MHCLWHGHIDALKLVHIPSAQQALGVTLSTYKSKKQDGIVIRQIPIIVFTFFHTIQIVSCRGLFLKDKPTSRRWLSSLPGTKILRKIEKYAWKKLIA